MKTLYLDCGMGAAGDMLTAALLELLPEQAALVEELNQLGIPSVHYEASAMSKCGIGGTHMRVTIHGHEEDTNHDHHDHTHTHDHDHGYHHHEHRSMADIAAIVQGTRLTPQLRQEVLAVYSLIAEAESQAHGVPVTEVHFHEVGAMDAIADVAAVCLLMSKLAPDQVVISPIHVGSGHVHCAHGILPVPAPATAYILRGLPIYGGSVDGELCTPTGAALLKHFATSFGPMPVMETEAIGYGMGKRDYPAANCVRAMIGTSTEEWDQLTQIQQLAREKDLSLEDVLRMLSER